MSTFDPKRYWSARLAESYSLTGVGWLSLGEPFNRWMYRVRRHVFRRMARPVLGGRGDATVLDVGSGTGFYVRKWQELGVRRITATDLTDVAVEKLGRRFPAAQCRVLDVTAEPPADLVGRFDAVSAMDVLFHVVDDGAYHSALRTLGALVKPGGLVVLSENFVHDGAQRTVHQVSRTAEEIGLRASAEAGLQPLRRAPMFVLMNTPVDRPNAAAPPALGADHGRRTAWAARLCCAGRIAVPLRARARLGALPQVR